MYYQLSSEMSVSANHSLNAFGELGFVIHYFDRALDEYVDEVDEAKRRLMESENLYYLQENNNRPEHIRYVVQLFNEYENFLSALRDLRSIQSNVHTLSFRFSSVL